jgi:hypothetical protein
MLTSKRKTKVEFGKLEKELKKKNIKEKKRFGIEFGRIIYFCIIILVFENKDIFHLF